MSQLPLIEIPHHPSGGARPGEHKEDANIAVGLVNTTLALAVTPETR